MKKKKLKYMYLSLIGVLGMLLLISIPTIAKYVYNSVLDYYLESKGFYFASDYLDTTLLNNVNNLWNGESTHFTIRNNLNDSVITEYDINYKIECTIKGEAANYTKCNLNGTDSNIYNGVLSKLETCINNSGDGVDVSLLDSTNCEISGYKWENQISEKDNYFDIELTNNNYELKDLVVNISATSTSPYTKTIIGDFVLHKISYTTNNIVSIYKEYENYTELIISNNSLDNKCINISWNPDNLKISLNNDNVNEYYTDNNNINKIKTSINSSNNNRYIFYKQNLNSTYDISEFTIEELSDC